MDYFSQPASASSSAGDRTPATDLELVEQAKGGDAAAFDELYRRHLDPVYACAARILRDNEEAAEATQDTFLTAWQRLSAFHFVGESALPWLLVTCRYKSLNRRRQLDRRDRHQSSIPLDETTLGAATSDTDTFEISELVAAIDAAVSRLSELDRRLYQLCFVEGMTYTDAAQRMGASNGSVRNRLSRLRDRLRSELSVLKGSS
jgi:RNA polymerase sigma-70 factor (ECF subfamily)